MIAGGGAPRIGDEQGWVVGDHFVEYEAYVVELHAAAKCAEAEQIEVESKRIPCRYVLELDEQRDRCAEFTRERCTSEATDGDVVVGVVAAIGLEVEQRIRSRQRHGPQQR